MFICVYFNFFLLSALKSSFPTATIGSFYCSCSNIAALCVHIPRQLQSSDSSTDSDVREDDFWSGLDRRGTLTARHPHRWVWVCTVGGTLMPMMGSALSDSAAGGAMTEFGLGAGLLWAHRILLRCCSIGVTWLGVTEERFSVCWLY